MTAVVLNGSNKNECNLLKEILYLNINQEPTKTPPPPTTTTTTTTIDAAQNSNLIKMNEVNYTNNNNNNTNYNTSNNNYKKDLNFNGHHQNDYKYNDEHYEDEDDYELKQILYRVTKSEAIRNNTTSTTNINHPHSNNTNNNNKDYNFTYNNSNNISSHNSNVNNSAPNSNEDTSAAVILLFKLLKHYKLEHYATDLVDCGFLTPNSLNDLTEHHLTKMNVSAYDSRKFTALQAVIKQSMTTLKTPHPASKTNTHSHYHSSSTSTQPGIKKQHSLNSKTNSQNVPIWEAKSDGTSKFLTKSHQVSSASKRPLTSAKSLPETTKIRTKSQQDSKKSPASPTALDQPSVRHPVQNSSKSKSAYFGPKLNHNQIQLVEMKGYNYGVPKINQQSDVIKQYRRSLSANTAHKSGHHTTSATHETHPNLADIYVFARKRPKLAVEARLNDVIHVETGSVIVNESRLAVDGTQQLRQNEFNFDKCFDASISNEDLFKNSILPFVEDASNRTDFNCICFGQTGSGKTHTLFGSKTAPGLCSMTANALFNQNEKLVCGFYEIYNGQLYDLFNQNSRLVLREDSHGLVNVVGLVEMQIHSISQLKKAIETGQANRHIGSTSFNKASSRSHAVLQLKIQDKTSVVANSYPIGRQSSISALNQPKPRRNFRVLFIDLAGSERGIDAQTNKEDNRKEVAEINQSLLALKECIRSIDQFHTHAPFRQSKLTRVLRDCFIGSGQTVLLATVSPTDDCVQCSLNTLQYANRVRQMTLRNRKKMEKRDDKRAKITKSRSIDNKMSHNQPEAVATNGIRLAFEPLTTEKNIIREDSDSDSLVISASTRKLMNDPAPKQAPVKVAMTSNAKLDEKAQSIIAKYERQKQSLLQQHNPPPTLIEFENPNFNKNIENKKIENVNLKPTNKEPKVPSLFHPSKINMASTPIKTNGIERRIPPKGDEQFLENDTLIKGHKVKENNLIIERYFENAKGGVQQQPVLAKPAPKGKTSLGENQKAVLTKPTKVVAPKYDENDTEEDADINDLDKSIDARIDDPSFVDENKTSNESERLKDINREFSKHYKQLFAHLYSPLSTSNSSNEAKQQSSADDRLESNGNLRDLKINKKPNGSLLGTSLLDSLTYKEISANEANNKLKASEAKKQLQYYIENLEKKLVNLRTEMKDSSGVDSTMRLNDNRSRLLENKAEALANKSGKKSESSESIDSMKEIVNTDDYKLKKNTMENCANSNAIKFETISTKVLNSQKFMTPNLSPASTFAESTDENPDSDALKRSIHKGDCNNVFDKAKAVKTPTDNYYNPSSHFQFNSIDAFNFKAADSEDVQKPGDTDNVLVKTPVALKVTPEYTQKITPCEFIVHENNLYSPRDSSIWTKPSGPNKSAPSTFRSVSSSSVSRGANEATSDNEARLETSSSARAIQHMLFASKPDLLQYSPANLTKTKSLLVIAHENQLSDITETCKEEMNLLSGFRDSRVDFNEYLDKMEEMLRRKTLSILDLQQQIKQIKMIKNSSS